MKWKENILKSKEMAEEADTFKQLGNDEIKKGNYQAAISHFTEAIGNIPSTHFSRGTSSLDLLLQQSSVLHPALQFQ